MSEEMKKLLELISADEELKQKINDICEADRPVDEKKLEVVALAKELGVTITKEELDEMEDDNQETQMEALSDEELAAVSGGGGCACLFPGGGGGDGLKCGCFTGGAGRVFEYRPDTHDYRQLPWAQGACLCSGPGAGATRRH